jgi:hypothetical protein
MMNIRCVVREHLEEEVQSGWPEMSPYTGPIFDEASKMAMGDVYVKVIDRNRGHQPCQCSHRCARRKK